MITRTIAGKEISLLNNALKLRVTASQIGDIVIPMRAVFNDTDVLKKLNDEQINEIKLKIRSGDL